MRVVITIDDSEIKREIATQVAAAVSELGSEAIHAEVMRIMAIKADRFTDQNITDMIAKSMEGVIKARVNGFGGNSVVDHALATAARSIMSERIGR